MKKMYYNNYICQKLGKIENLKIKKNKSIELKKNEVRLKILAIGLNYVDTLMIKGDYQYKNKLPFVPGTEACGIIVEENCNDIKLLNRKSIIFSKSGCFSEEAIINKSQLVLLEKNFSSLDGASFFSSALTAYVTLLEKAKIKKNNFILITGASGGVGQACVKLALHLKAKVICIVSNKKKAALLKELGVEKIIFINNDIKKEVMEFTNNEGANIVLDINGLLKEKNILGSLSWNGKYLIVGFTNNNIGTIKTNYILIKSIQIFGVRAGEFLRRCSIIKKKKVIKDIFSLYKKGVFKVERYSIKPFNKLIYELIKIRDRKSIGKIIIKTKHLDNV